MMWEACCQDCPRLESAPVLNSYGRASLLTSGAKSNRFLLQPGLAWASNLAFSRALHASTVNVEYRVLLLIGGSRVVTASIKSKSGRTRRSRAATYPSNRWFLSIKPDVRHDQRQRARP